MSNARFLRPTSTDSFEVYIALDEPVAKITPSPPTFVGTGGGIYQMSQILHDGSLRYLADGDSLLGLANRLSDGEFDNDFRYEITENPEPDQPSDMYFVRRIATPSQRVLESFSTDDPGREVEAAREAQEYTLEERLGPFGLEWEREQEARRTGR